MSIRSVKTTYTSSASSQSISSFPPTMTTTTMSMTSPNILGSIDLNMSPSLSKFPPGLSNTEKRFNGRPRSGSLSVHGGSSGSPYLNSAAKNTYPSQWSINGSNNSWNSQAASGSRSFNNRPGNKRYPQGMRLPSSSYNQAQNQHRRASFSSVQGQRGKSVFGEGLAMQHVFSGYGGSPVYQRTSRFDPFEDSNDSAPAPVPAIAAPLLSSPLAPSPPITSRSPPVSSTTTVTNPTYTHYYYYDPTTNSPTLAYADADNHTPHLLNTGINTPASHGNLNLTSSANLLLETIINGRNNTSRKPVSRSPSPPSPQSSSYPSVVEAPSVLQPENPARPSAVAPASTEPPARQQNRSPSPPHSPRPRSAAISRPAPSISAGSVANPVQNPAASATTISPPPPPLPVKPVVRSKPVKSQRDAIANIVASMMLNRADGCGRRGRRCGSTGAYVKSGLSRVIFVE